MTTDLTHYTVTSPAVVAVDHRNQAVAALTEWAESAQAAWGIASKLVESSFVPQQFRGKPEEATAAILAGLEVGLQPMAALRSFDIINGQAAPRAMTLRAVVQSHGHEIELVESTGTRCVMRGRRRGGGEWQRVAWTIDRAGQLGLLGKDNWKRQPAAMLVARATSEICRLVASDAILGLGYAAEEVADGGPAEVAGPVDTGEAAGPGTKRMSRTRRTATPEPDDEPDDGHVVEAVPVDDEPAPTAVPTAPAAPPDDRVWADLAVALGERFDPASTVPAIQAKVRGLFDLMDQARMPKWTVDSTGQDALHVALARRDAAHLSDLRRDALVDFATRAFDAAAEAWESHQQPPEGDALDV